MESSMPTQNITNQGNTPSADVVRAQTKRILASPELKRSSSLSRLLRFVVEETLNGNGHELKEYRLGVDVFERGADFDPRVDPVVRIQAAKLRSRLAEYYSSEGRNDKIRIAIMKGGYVPTFTFVHGREEKPAALKAADKQSIAVLPFVNISADPENEHFTDGLTEELINVLTSVPGLRVVARTSAFSFKNSRQDIRDIGAQLNAHAVIEGSVRKDGNRLRVTAQLVEVSSGYHLFSRSFKRELNDVFAAQDDLANAFASEVIPALGTAQDSFLPWMMAASPSNASLLPN
jgi:adenylate cyclase